jgi:hypothetical protein
MELPVTTVPIVRTPLHHSYVAYLASFSESLAMSYIVSALHLCRLTRTSVSYLVHPTDLVGADAVPALRFFPGMGLSTTRKQQLLRSCRWGRHSKPSNHRHWRFTPRMALVIADTTSRWRASDSRQLG